MVVTRGSIWWGETPEAKGRPFLVVSRDAANEVMARVLVAPITSRIRGAPSELPVGADEGLPLESVAAFDNLRPIPQAMLSRKLGELSSARIHEICRAAAMTLDC